MTNLSCGKLRGTHARRGFTLIEMMIVVAIILILMALLLAIGVGAKARAQRRATLATLKICEAAMQDYMKTNPEPLPPASWPAVYTNSKLPAYDKLNLSNSNPVTFATIQGSDITNWVARLLADQEASQKLVSLPKGKDISATPLNVILDAWGTPIRYIHSGSYNTTNASYSVSAGYFMSAGPDGKFSMSVNNTSNNWPVDEILSTDLQ